MSISISKKILYAICLVLCIILMSVFLINCTLFINGLVDSDNVPSIFGYYPLVVLSDSMLGEFKNGDLVICKTSSADNIEIGDIISFYDPDLTERKIVTHRVIDIEIKNEEIFFLTKGDFNNGEDKCLVSENNMVGQYLFCIKNLGNVILFLQSTKGLLLCVFLPTFVLLTIEYLKNMPQKGKKGDNYELQNS